MNFGFVSIRIFSWLIVVVSSGLQVGCSKSDLEEINFDYDRIIGVYSSSISGLPNTPNLWNLEISISRKNADTFCFSFDMQEYDSITNIDFTLTPSSIDRNGQYWTMVWADIELILGNEYIQFRPPKFSNHDDSNYVEYADTYQGNFARYQVTFQSIDSLDTYSYISISGERDYK